MKIKNICCIGAGFVGGPTMAVIAKFNKNINVYVVDHDSEKIKRWNDPDFKKIPVFESGLNEILKETRNKNLFFTDDIDSSIVKSQIIFLAVNTPTKTKGEGKGFAADLTNIIKCAKKIAKVSTDYKIIVEKSTLPVRTAEKLKEVLELNSKDNFKFQVISNPEFLAEGTAIKDLYKSDRVLIGGENSDEGKNAVNSLINIYSKWIPKNKIITTNVWSSELSKLASNAMLAQRISSINSLSAICDKTGADIDEVSKVIGMDKRIGSSFLKPSPGFGGSCFQKDILNLVYLCRYYNLEEVANFWLNVVKINDYQRLRLATKVINYINGNNLRKEVILLGWSFKKDTNDSRESSSIYISKHLIENNFKIHIFDPKLTSKAKVISDIQNFSPPMTSNLELISRIEVYKSLTDIIKNEFAIIILTEWDEFKILNKLKLSNYIFDFRNILEKNKSNICL